MPEPGARPTLSRAVENLPPGYFALVMATGIVSIACHVLGLPAVGLVLLWVSAGAYAVLWFLTLARLVLHGDLLAADLSSHARGPGFFTLPAATCVLGSQLVILDVWPAAASASWVLGTVLWALVTYGFFTAVTAKPKKPTLAEGLNGTWLIAVVAMQSIAVLGCLVGTAEPVSQRVLFVAAAMHVSGFMLYLPLIGLLLYRWMFFEFSPQELTPPYWINMGALAISALAGARLVQAAPDLPLLARIEPFLAGFTFFLWAAATWWIPLLAVLGFWRHVVRRVSFSYDPQYWGMVFPLGMYTACTAQMSLALDLPDLMIVAHVFAWVALAAWTLTSGGLALHLARAARRV